MHSLKSGMLWGLLAVAGCTAVYAAPPKSDVAPPAKNDVAAPPKSDVDVTITVIDDPAQLNERVNTIVLPGSDGDDAKAARHRNKDDAAPAVDKASEAGESARHDAADARDAANESAAGKD